MCYQNEKRGGVPVAITSGERIEGLPEIPEEPGAVSCEDIAPHGLTGAGEGISHISQRTRNLSRTIIIKRAQQSIDPI